MKLLVIVLCLLSERYLTHRFSAKRLFWFDGYCHKLLSSLTHLQSITHLSLFNISIIKILYLVLPFPLILILLLYVSKFVLFGIITFILHLIVFYDCIGPDNPFYPLSHPVEVDEQPLAEESMVSHYFVAVNRQLFAVIFWYMVSGPVVILCYRLIERCQKTLAQDTSALAMGKWILDVLDWLPSRLTALLYLFVGNFQQGFQYWVQTMSTGLDENEILLRKIGLLAARSHHNEDVSMPFAQNLVEQALVILVVFFALLTIVAWL